MRAILATLIAVLFLIPAFAHAEMGDPANDANEALVGLYVGQYSVFRTYQESSPMLGGELSGRDVYHGLRPTAGGFVTGNGTLYGGVGLIWDLPLGIAPIFITPGFIVGAYDQGNGKDLGFGIEFRSTFEATYQFDEGQRLGFSVSHLSNASLGNNNPGVETFQAVYRAPLNYFTK